MLIRPLSVHHTKSEPVFHTGLVKYITIGFKPESLTGFVPNTVGANHTGGADIDVDIITVDVTIEPDVGIRMLPGTHGDGQPKLDMDGLPDTDWDM